MSVKTAQGGYAFAGGQDTVDFCLPLVPGTLVLTNNAQADAFLNADTSYQWKVDLRPFRQVKLTGYIKTTSASANSPKLQLRYYTATSTTASNFVQLGASSVEISMFTGTVFADSGWIDLKEAARIDNCFLGLFNSGGDGAADPAINNVYAYFK